MSSECVCTKERRKGFSSFFFTEKRKETRKKTYTSQLCMIFYMLCESQYFPPSLEPIFSPRCLTKFPPKPPFYPFFIFRFFLYLFSQSVLRRQKRNKRRRKQQTTKKKINFPNISKNSHCVYLEPVPISLTCLDLFLPLYSHLLYIFSSE